MSVWSSAYEAVYHLSDGAVDATANHHDGTVYAGAPSPTTGAIASALAFAGNASVLVADAPSLDLPQLTVSGWVQVTAAPTGYASIIGRSVMLSNYDDFMLALHHQLQRVEVATGPTTDIGFDSQTVALDGWAHVALTADANELTPFLDGSAGSPKPTGGDVAHDPTPIVIGADEESADEPNANFLDGAADEIRIEHGVRTPAWLRYDDLAQRDQVIDYDE
jgi:hypothetical protein